MNRSQIQRIARGAARLGGPLVVTATLFFAGCANQTEVATLVAQSNAAMLTSQLGGLPQKGGPAPASWEAANDRIESFIAAHADQKETVAPLRIRQAMLLLENQKLSLARAAFDAADKNSLHTDRDQALKRQQAHLLWWFGVSTADTWQESDQSAAKAALKDFKDELSRPNVSADTLLYFAELRAWIGLTAARQTTSVDERRMRLADAIDTFGSALTAGDLEILNNGAEEKAESGGLPIDVRRRLMARVVLKEFQKYNAERSVGAHANNPQLEKLIRP